MIRNADRQALRERAVHARVAHPLDEQLLGPRLNVFRLEVLRDVEPVRRPGAGPDAGQVRLAIRRPRRWRREIGLAVRQPRNSGRGVVEPLREDRWCRQQRNGEDDGTPHDEHDSGACGTPGLRIISSLPRRSRQAKAAHRVCCVPAGGGCHMRQMARASAALSALLWIIVPATVAIPATAAAQDAKTVVENALRALGAANLNSIVYSGEGAYGNFGQSRTISFGLASTSIRNYTARDRFHEAGVSRDGPGRANAGASWWASSCSRTTVSIRSAHAGWRVVGRTDGHLGHAMGVPQRRGGERGNGALAEDRGRHLQRGDVEPGAESAVRPAVSSDWIHQPAAVHRARRDVDRASRVRRHACRDLFTGLRGLRRRPQGADADPAEPRRHGNVRRSRSRGARQSVRPRDADDADGTAACRFSSAQGRPPRRSWPTASIASPADMCRSPSSSKTTSSCSRAGRAKRAGWPSSQKRSGCSRTSASSTSSTRTRTSITRAGWRRSAAEGAIVLTDDNSKYFVEQALLSPRTLVGDTLAKSKKKPKVEGVDREDGAAGRDADGRAASCRRSRAQRRDADRVSAEGEDSVHGGLQSAGAGPAGRARRLRRWCRTSSGCSWTSIGTSWSTRPIPIGR